MAGKRRLDQFVGSQSEYILYLERQLTKARRLLIQPKSTPRTLEHPQRCPQGALNQSPDNVVDGKSNSAAISPPPNIPENYMASALDGHLTSQRENRLEVIPYGITRLRACKEEASWRKELCHFLETIPVAGLWQIKIEELQLSCTIQDVLTRFFTDSKILGLLSELSPFPLLRDAMLRSQRTSLLLSNSIVQISLFSDLLFVSICKVALYLGYAVTDVYEKMSKAFGCRHTKSLDRLLRGASWANRCISMLFVNGWEHRSTEAFLLFGKSIEFYGRVSDYKESFTLLEKQLTASEYRMVFDKVSGWIPYSIPSIIKIIVGDALTLPGICTYLGYNKDYAEASVNLPDQYRLLLKQDDVPLTKKKCRRAIIDGDEADGRDSGVDATLVAVQIDTNEFSANQTLCEPEQSHLANESLLKSTWNQLPAEDASLPMVSSSFAENPLPSSESPFDVSSMMNLGFDISQMLEVDMSTTTRQECSGLPTSTALVAAQFY